MATTTTTTTTTTMTTTTTTEEDDDDAANQRTVGRCSPLLTCAALDVLSSLCYHARDGVVTLATNNGGGDPTTSSPSSSCCASIEGDMVGSVSPPFNILTRPRPNALYAI